MTCQNLFSGENKKNIKFLFAYFAQRVVKFKQARNVQKETMITKGLGINLLCLYKQPQWVEKVTKSRTT